MTDYKNLKLRASSNPHIRNGEDTRGLMLDVIIALMPALLFGVWHFGVRVAISAVVSVASAIFFEWLYRKLLHKPQMIGDLSAAVTGLLLSMVCPPELPVWMLVVGNFFAIFVVKQLYGGLGKNFLNPALAARAALVACYASAMTSWSKVDAATGATPRRRRSAPARRRCRGSGRDAARWPCAARPRRSAAWRAAAPRPPRSARGA